MYNIASVENYSHNNGNSKGMNEVLLSLKIYFSFQLTIQKKTEHTSVVNRMLIDVHCSDQ